MKEFIRKKWFLKVIAILGAIVLWLYVANVGYRTDNIDEDIPLELHNIPFGYSVAKDIDAVKLKVRAPAATWENLSPDSFSAYLDLKGLEAGSYNLEVKVTSEESDVQIVEKIPKRVNVRLEETLTETLPINGEVTGSPGENFKAFTPELSVTEATVIGPQSRVAGIDKLVARVNLNGETEEIDLNAEVIALDVNGEEISDLEIDPGVVEARVSFEKETSEGSVEIDIQITGTPKDGYVEDGVTVSPEAVSVEGRADDLTNLSYIQTEPVDITGADSNVVKNVGLVVPSGITVSVSEVTVTVKIRETESTKNFDIDIRGENLGQDLNLVTLEPNKAVISAKGSPDALNSINYTAFGLKIDLTGKKAGTYDIPLSPSMVSTPDGVTVESINPGAVRVVIEKKK